MVPSRWPAIIVLFMSIALVAGCKKEDTGPAPGPQPGTGGPEPTGPYAAGIKVFNQKCTNCHTIGTAGGKKVDLAKVAADSTHTEEWLRDFILDPKSKKPNTRMPSFQGKLSDEEFKSLLAYLVSLK
jgi:cytochrome c2